MSWNIAKPGDQINGPVAVTGNLNVDSNTLFVDSANNRVGVLTASPTVPLDVVGDAKVSGNLTVDTNTLVVDAANNRLGIGTAFPGTKVDIIGGVIRINNGSSGSAANDGILLDNSATTAPNNYLPAINWNTGTLTWATIDGLRAGGGGYGGTIRISTMDSANSNTERLRIASNGVCTWSNVGGVVSNAMVLSGDGLKIGTGSGFNSSRLVVADASPKTSGGQSITLGTATGGANDFQLIVARTSNTTGCYYFQTVEQGVGYKNLVFQPDGGNVGIGTATPAATLTVNTSSSAGSAYISSDSTGGSFRSSGNLQFYTDNAAYSIDWFSANKGSLKMRLTNDGNLGLGATPSAWSGGRAIDVGTSGAFYGDGLTYDWRVGATMNAYRKVAFNNWYYKATGQPAGRYDVASGGSTGVVHTWQTAASGTADALISWTTAMTLDASGNLRVGAAAAAGVLTVTNSTTNTSIGLINLSGFANTNTNSIDFYLDNSNSGVVTHGVIGCINTAATANRYGELFFKTANAAAPVTRIRIKPQGQLNLVPISADPAGPEAGDVYYNSTTNKLRCYNGTTWNDLF